jgi:NAD+ kinase
MSTAAVSHLPRRFAVVYHPGISDAETIGEEITAMIRARHPENQAMLFPQEETARAEYPTPFDMVVALGGDGTMLRTTHVCAQSGIPILGVNLGRLGFLAEFGRADWRQGLERVLAGDYWIEQRMMLHVELEREGRSLGTWHVLNECAVTRGGVMKMIHLEAAIDGHTLTTYAADGLLAATPTGSTAYALAAGGPILPPEIRNILLVPVAPHLSVERAIVLPEGAEVGITVHSDVPVILSCDGQSPVDVGDGDHIRAFASDRTARFVRVQGRGYFYHNITSRLNRNPQNGGQD